MADPSRAFQAGAVQANLNTAISALVAATCASLAADGFEHDRTETISAALDLVKLAAAEPVSWNPPK